MGSVFGFVFRHLGLDFQSDTARKKNNEYIMRRADKMDKAGCCRHSLKNKDSIWASREYTLILFVGFLLGRSRYFKCFKDFLSIWPFFCPAKEWLRSPWLRVSNFYDFWLYKSQNILFSHLSI